MSGWFSDFRFEQVSRHRPEFGFPAPVKAGAEAEDVAHQDVKFNFARYDFAQKNSAGIRNTHTARINGDVETAAGFFARGVP